MSAIDNDEVKDPQHVFLFRLSLAGGELAHANNLPIPAMLACGAVESGWGNREKRPIFKATGCHFNLQKPSWYTWMKCKTINLKTDAQGDGHLVSVDFCCADNWEDSVGLWCTWIINYPNTKLRDEVLMYRDRPRDFCARLPKVGFGPQHSTDDWDKTAKGYLDVYDQFQLGTFTWVGP
jgi:hypothetical protein